MSEKKELIQEQLDKVSGGEETNSTHALFKPGYVAAPHGGGAVYNDGAPEFKSVTDQYQPDLNKPTNQGGVDNPETKDTAFGLGK